MMRLGVTGKLFLPSIGAIYERRIRELEERLEEKEQ